jgi:hypothetical protein
MHRTFSIHSLSSLKPPTSQSPELERLNLILVRSNRHCSPSPSQLTIESNVTFHQVSIPPLGLSLIHLISRLKMLRIYNFRSANTICRDSPASTLSNGFTFVRRYEITNLGAKIGQAVAYHSNNSLTTYRLEIPHPDGSGDACFNVCNAITSLCGCDHIMISVHAHTAVISHTFSFTAIKLLSGLYEGIRFAWVNMTAPPSQSFHITALRLVCQIKPQNWAGKFAAVGDDKLSRLWYLGAYTVKVNLLADQFGSILIYRGIKSTHRDSEVRDTYQAIDSAGLEMPTLRRPQPWFP